MPVDALMTLLDQRVLQFIDEYVTLRNGGLTFQSTTYQVRLKIVLCDALARAFVKGIKSHNGISGCERCIQRGQKVNGTWTYQDFDAPFRNNENFRTGEDCAHHTCVSPFEEIEELDMVLGFVLDYMHLVLLGVKKRLLQKVWLGYIPHRFSEHQTRTFDSLTALLARALPSDFHRKGRPLAQISRWKAVEFRVFLLYTGPLILKKVLSPEKYQHFFSMLQLEF